MNFAKFLTTPILQNTSRRLLLPVVCLLFMLPLRMNAYHMCSVLLFLPLAWVGLRHLQHIIYLSIYIYIYYLSVCLSVCLSVYLSIYIQARSRLRDLIWNPPNKIATPKPTRTFSSYDRNPRSSSEKHR